MADQERKDKVEQIVAALQNYVATYTDQQCYKTYSDEIIIEDILYGLGIALDREQYSFHDGFIKFKERLIEHITPKEKE